MKVILGADMKMEWKNQYIVLFENKTSCQWANINSHFALFPKCKAKIVSDVKAKIVSNVKGNFSVDKAHYYNFLLSLLTI